MLHLNNQRARLKCLWCDLTGWSSCTQVSASALLTKYIKILESSFLGRGIVFLQHENNRENVKQKERKEIMLQKIYESGVWKSQRDSF